MDAIEDLEIKYDELLSEYNKAKDELKELGSEKDIEFELEKYSAGYPTEFTTQDTIQPDSQIEDQIRELEALIESESKQIEEVRTRNEASAQEVENTIKAKKEELEQLLSQSDKTGASNSDLSAKEKEVADLKRQFEEYSAKYEQTRQSAQKLDSNISFLLSENSNKEAAHNSLAETVAKLREEVKSSRNQIIELNEELKKSLHVCRENKTDQAQERELVDAEAKLEVLRKKAQAEEEEQKKLEEELKKLNAEGIEREQKLKKDLQNLKERETKAERSLEHLKEQRETLLAEKKKKSKEGTDYKSETIRLKQENERLEAQRERQLKKSEEFSQLKKTYVKQEQLQALKQELDKYNDLNRPIEASKKKFIKLEEVHKGLTKSIEDLKKNERRLINEKENNLNQTKEKVKELMESKTFYEKNISHCQTKLNEYIREFPDHEKEKLAAKQLEKERKAEEKRAKKETEDQEKKRVKTTVKTQKEENVIPEFLPQDQDTQSAPFYMDQTFQMAALLAVILILAGSYALL